MINTKRFPFFKQLDTMDCGPASLKIIAKYYGRNFSMKYLRDKCNITREGVSLLAISKTAEDLELRTLALKATFEDLKNKIPLPCIIHWEYRHFVVVYKITKNKVYVSDPQVGLITYSIDEFCHSWKRNEDRGILLTLEPTNKFLEQDNVETTSSLWDFFAYLKPHKFLLFIVLVGMIMNIALSLVFPMITQSVVDIGIFTADLTFINLLLVASVILTLSSNLSGYFQKRVMLFVGDKVSISMVSDFIRQLMKLPVAFFERKMVSDIISRVADHNRIQQFIFDTLLGLTVAFLSILLYGAILYYYNSSLLLIYLVGTVFYIIWIVLFLRSRRKLDYQFFDANIVNQGEVIQIFDAIKDIKVNNLQQKKRWDWEKSRLDIYNLNIKMLNLNELQEVGSTIIDQIKNTLLTFFAAKAVIDGQMSLGMMLSVQYIIGQLNGPVGGILGFIQSSQEANISLERVSEIRFDEEEEKVFEGMQMPLPLGKDIVLKDVCFKYSNRTPNILDHINLTIPHGKTTAIVGASGSGKSTLMKVLLRFYEITEGKIWLDSVDFKSVNINEWRDQCGAVLQEGKILSGSVLQNITLEDQDIDTNKLLHAVQSANLVPFIESQPNGFYTYIGDGGTGISGGQKQRVLIARAIYKDPAFIFFDEATNALDANNEMEISNNIVNFTKGRTAVVIAHRLSTIRSADQIVVLDKGKIVELGTHESLLEEQGQYYNLVKNQMLND